MGKINALPKMIGVQADGCSPIVNAHLKGQSEPIAISRPFTDALAILVRNPLNGQWALETMKESKGTAIAVSDSEIIAAEQEVARLEGIFAEPSSSATIAALKKLVDQGIVQKQDKIVCLITGSGLKATDVLQALTKKRKTAVVGLDLSTKEKILRILSRKEAYGYELWKKLGKTMTRAAVYQHLSNLLERGMVISYEKEGRKYFKTTKRGKRILKALDELKVLL
jgi:threonine synthase